MALWWKTNLFLSLPRTAFFTKAAFVLSRIKSSKGIWKSRSGRWYTKKVLPWECTHAMQGMHLVKMMLVDLSSFKNSKQKAHPSKDRLTVLSKTKKRAHWINALKCGAFMIATWMWNLTLQDDLGEVCQALLRSLKAWKTHTYSNTSWEYFISALKCPQISFSSC